MYRKPSAKYPINGKNYTVKEFEIELTALEDSISDREHVLSAMDDLSKMVAPIDMQVINRHDALRAPLQRILDKILGEHEKTGYHSGAAGFYNIARMGKAMELNEALNAESEKPRAQKGFASALPDTDKPRDSNTLLKIFNPDDAPSRSR